MFQKLIFPALLFISIFIISFIQLYAQEEEGEIIIISEKVGEVIDKEEIKKYNLFQGVKGLQSGVFLNLPDGSYVFKVIYIDETTGEEKVERITQTEWIIKQYGNRIDHLESILLKKPPLKPMRIAGEVLWSTVSGGMVAFLFGIAGAIITGTGLDDEDLGNGLFIGYFVGWTVGSSLGV